MILTFIHTCNPRCLAWCPGQSKRIAPLSFFHGCRKRRLSINTWDGLRSNDDGLTICYVCSITHSKIILKEYLRCLCYPFWDKAWAVCMYVSTLYLWKASRDIADIPPTSPSFTKMTLRNTADLIGGKSIV
jgi:hypothetical protein